MASPSLIDTNILVYCFDPRTPGKQHIARRLLQQHLARDAAALPHQAVVEFVAAVTKTRADLGGPLLTPAAASRAAERLTREFPILYPDEAVLSTALRGNVIYQLSWYDAHLWAYAEANGIPEILSEDFTHGRHYGSVRVRNPFLSAAGKVHELPPMYETD